MLASFLDAKLKYLDNIPRQHDDTGRQLRMEKLGKEMLQSMEVKLRGYALRSEE